VTLLRRRYARSGSGSSWFPALLAAAFAGLAVWAAIAGDWLTAAIAAVMVCVAGGGYIVMRRVRATGDGSKKDEVADE
jgi:Flp pilus assembly protein TadB